MEDIESSGEEDADPPGVEWDAMRMIRDCRVVAHTAAADGEEGCVQFFTCRYTENRVDVVCVLAVMLVTTQDGQVPIMVCSCDSDKRGDLLCRVGSADRTINMPRAEFALRYPTCRHAIAVAHNQGALFKWPCEVYEGGFLSHRSTPPEEQLSGAGNDGGYSREYGNYENMSEGTVVLANQSIVVVFTPCCPPAVVRRVASHTAAGQERWMCEACSSAACHHTALCNQVQGVDCMGPGRRVRARLEPSPLPKCVSKFEIGLPLSPEVAAVVYARLEGHWNMHSDGKDGDDQVCAMCGQHLVRIGESATVLSLHASRVMTVPSFHCQSCKTTLSYDGNMEGVLNLDNKSVRDEDSRLECVRYTRMRTS